MMNSKITCLFTAIRFNLILLSIFFFLSCGGGGGGGGSDSAPVSNNLSATQIAVETDEPTIGYPLKVSVMLGADTATNNVSVSLFAIDNTEDPAAEVRQIPLGTETIDRMEQGERVYEFDVNIPSSVEFPGDYYIAAIIDPAEEMAETNEDDNSTTVATTLYPGEPNLLLTELALDRTALLIDTRSYEEQVPGTQGNVHNADAGGTITVGTNGLGVDETVGIEAFAKLRISRADNGTSYDVPLYLWYSEAGRYINAYGIDPETGAYLGAQEWLPLGLFTPQLVERAGEDVTLNDVTRDSTHIDFYFPGKLGTELENAMRYADLPVNTTAPTVPPPDLTSEAISQLRSFLRNLPSNGIRGDESEAMAVMDFAVCVEIRPVDSTVVDFLVDDNERCSPLAISLPPLETAPPEPETNGYTPQFSTPSGSLFTGDGFGTRGGGVAFSYGLEFGASASADNRGYIEEMHGSVPVSIFTSTFEFMRVTVRAQMVPDYLGRPTGEDSGYTVELRFLDDRVLYAESFPPGSSPEFSVSFSKDVPASASDGNDENNADSPKVPKQYFIGPVPVDAGASASGNFGIAYSFEFTEAPLYVLGNQVSPFANVEANLYAGVGTSLFSAGVEGVLTLLDERLTLFSGTEIDVIDLGHVSGNAEFLINQGQKITNVFTGPQGALNLYAKYSVPKLVTCSWGIIKGKCLTTRTIKATKNIWKSGALFRLEDILYDDPNVEFDVVVLSGQEPMYFVP